MQRVAFAGWKRVANNFLIALSKREAPSSTSELSRVVRFEASAPGPGAEMFRGPHE